MTPRPAIRMARSPAGKASPLLPTNKRSTVGLDVDGAACSCRTTGSVGAEAEPLERQRGRTTKANASVVHRGGHSPVRERECLPSLPRSVSRRIAFIGLGHFEQ